MIRSFFLHATAAAVCVVLALPQASRAVGLDSVRFDECGGVACETAYAPDGASAVIEIRGSEPRHAGRLLALTLYNAATYEIARYDTVEVLPSGDFVFRVAVKSLRPGSYTYTVAPRYSRDLVGRGILSAAPGVVPEAVSWPTPGSSEEYRR